MRNIFKKDNLLMEKSKKLQFCKCKERSKLTVFSEGRTGGGCPVPKNARKGINGGYL